MKLAKSISKFDNAADGAADRVNAAADENLV